MCSWLFQWLSRSPVLTAMTIWLLRRHWPPHFARWLRARARLAGDDNARQRTPKPPDVHQE